MRRGTVPGTSYVQTTCMLVGVLGIAFVGFYFTLVVPLNEELDATQKQLQVAIHTRDTNHNALQQIRQVAQDQSDQKNQLEQTIRALISQNTQLEASCRVYQDDLKASSDALTKHNSDAHEREQQLELSLSVARSELDMCSRTTSEQDSLIASLQMEVVTITAQYDAVHAQNQQLHQNLALLQDEVAHFQQQKEQQQQQHQEVEQHSATASNQQQQQQQPQEQHQEQQQEQHQEQHQEQRQEQQQQEQQQQQQQDYNSGLDVLPDPEELPQEVGAF
jgi:chromosome segregation ATPase